MEGQSLMKKIVPSHHKPQAGPPHPPPDPVRPGRCPAGYGRCWPDRGRPKRRPGGRGAEYRRRGRVADDASGECEQEEEP